MVQFRSMRGEWKSGKENIAISTSCNGRSEYLDEQSAATINLQKVSFFLLPSFLFLLSRNSAGSCGT
jgi:hypothetical protein